MPVNGLLLTLENDPDTISDVKHSIEKRPEVDAGLLSERWLPVAVDTPDARSARETHTWLESLPGVLQVDVVYVALDEALPPVTP